MRYVALALALLSAGCDRAPQHNNGGPVYRIPERAVVVTVSDGPTTRRSRVVCRKISVPW
jgi:hypothetical protein